MKVTRIWSDDWEWVYIDGKLACQGHSVPSRDLLDALGVEHEELEHANHAWSAYHDQPETLEEYERLRPEIEAYRDPWGE